MLTRTVTIRNKAGFHMRPAGVLTNEMRKFASNVTIVWGEKQINAKNLIPIILEGIPCGAELTFVCEGDDEAEAMKKIEELSVVDFEEEAK